MMIVEAIARTLWASHWANEHERKREEDPEHVLPWASTWRTLHRIKNPNITIEDPSSKDARRSSVRWNDLAPQTPWQAYVEAGRLVGMIEQLNETTIDAAWDQALKREGLDSATLNEEQVQISKEDFGNCLATQALIEAGVPAREAFKTGTLWRVNHPKDHGLVVPKLKPSLPMIFSGVRCDVCLEDTGPEWANCDDCGRPTCSNCLVQPAARCQTCVDAREEDQ